MSHTPACVVVEKNARHELDFAEKTGKIGFGLDDLEMRPQGFELKSGELEIAREGEIENGLET